MKTAISIPTPLYEAGERYARQHGMRRSELYRKALAQFLQVQRRSHLTEELDAFFAAHPACHGLDAGWAETQAAALERDPW